MIKRQYFFSCKVSHDNNTGDYSWWNTIINVVSFFPDDGSELIQSCREMAITALRDEVERDISYQDIMVISLNRLR